MGSCQGLLMIFSQIDSRHLGNVSTGIWAISKSLLASEHYFFKITLSLGKSALSDSLLVMQIVNVGKNKCGLTHF